MTQLRIYVQWIAYHKRGGLHFLRIGRYRIQWSRVNSASWESIRQSAKTNPSHELIATINARCVEMARERQALPNVNDSWPFQ